MSEAQAALHKGEVILLADSEIALVALATRGHEAAFRKLYDLHLPKVYGLCLRLTGNRQMAEDATQEVFLQLWRKLGSFAGNSSFSTWLHSLATNTTISYLRKQKSWLQRIRGVDDYEVLAEQLETAPEIPFDALQLCLARLPERARLVFVLHAIEGYRQENIASVLGISPGTVKAQYHRARHLVENWLNALPEEE